MGFQLTNLAVVSLDTERAKDSAVTGAKAAKLARSTVAGLPVLSGFVLVSADRAPGAPVGEEAMRTAWRELAGADGAERALVVRSSSAHEDTEGSSMVGCFDSVLDVSGWDDFTPPCRRCWTPPVGSRSCVRLPTCAGRRDGRAGAADAARGHRRCDVQRGPGGGPP